MWVGKPENGAVAIRMHEMVVRGEIDNLVEGKTCGRLWLHGREDPVVLDLMGDCWRDLAGTVLKFRNLEPTVPGDFEIAARQQGLVGDITASRKVKVPNCQTGEVLKRRASGEEVPMVWKNTLYLEWFSEANGRVVIEAADFEMKVSERVWEMDQDAEEAQKLANIQAMGDFLNRTIGRLPATPGDQKPKELDQEEGEWDENKKEMPPGWDEVLAELNREYEEDLEEEEAWEREQESKPLPSEAMELAMQALELSWLDGKDEDAIEVASLLMQVSVSLAGALQGEDEWTLGCMLAILKRCLHWLDEALISCRRKIEKEGESKVAVAFEMLRDEVLALREQVIQLRGEIKGS